MSRNNMQYRAHSLYNGTGLGTYRQALRIVRQVDANRLRRRQTSRRYRFLRAAHDEMYEWLRAVRQAEPRDYDTETTFAVSLNHLFVHAEKVLGDTYDEERQLAAALIAKLKWRSQQVTLREDARESAEEH